jgi:hypothetical protein
VRVRVTVMVRLRVSVCARLRVRARVRDSTLGLRCSVPLSTSDGLPNQEMRNAEATHPHHFFCSFLILTTREGGGGSPSPSDASLCNEGGVPSVAGGERGRPKPGGFVLIVLEGGSDSLGLSLNQEIHPCSWHPQVRQCHLNS